MVDGLRSQHFEGRCWKNDCFYVPMDCEQWERRVVVRV